MLSNIQTDNFCKPHNIPQKDTNFVAKYKTMGANSSYKAMHDIVEQTKEGTIPILRQLLDITERGRSLGIVLFGAEQFVSDIHKRVKGNCVTQAFGRTNAIEITKEDFRFVPQVYKTMLTRQKQDEYIIQNPVFRSMLNINFPLPIYKYSAHKDVL